MAWVQVLNPETGEYEERWEEDGNVGEAQPEEQAGEPSPPDLLQQYQNYHGTNWYEDLPQVGLETAAPWFVEATGQQPPEMGLPPTPGGGPSTRQGGFGYGSVAEQLRSQAEDERNRFALYHGYLRDQLAQVERLADKAREQGKWQFLEELAFRRDTLLQQLAANPRHVAQWLNMVGLDANKVLQGSPLVQQAVAKSGIYPGTGQPGSAPSPTAGLVQAPASLPGPVQSGAPGAPGMQSSLPPIGSSGLPPAGQMPQFNFVRGRQAGYLSPEGVRGMLNAYRGNTDLANLTTGLASLSGQNEGDFWSDFLQSLPQGQVTGPSRYA